MLANPGTQGLSGDSLVEQEWGVKIVSTGLETDVETVPLSQHWFPRHVRPYLIFSPKAAEMGVIFIPSLWIRGGKEFKSFLS